MRHLAPSVLAIVGISFLASCTAGPPPATLVLVDGAIYTMEAERSWAEAVVITDNQITAVLESSEEAEPFIGSSLRIRAWTHGRTVDSFYTSNPSTGIKGGMTRFRCLVAPAPGEKIALSFVKICGDWQPDVELKELPFAITTETG